MHADTEQLLSLRDGEPVDARVREHVAQCNECSAALARLGETARALRALPAFEPPAGVWQAVQRRAARTRRWPLTAALAAGLALAALAVWRVAPGPGAEAPAQAQVQPAAPTVVASSVDELLVQSRQLERVLRSLDAHAPQVMDVRTAGTIAGLEDGIAMIDYGLMRVDATDDAASQHLWNRRVALMNTLVQVRGAQLQQVSNRGTQR